MTIQYDRDLRPGDVLGVRRTHSQMVTTRRAPQPGNAMRPPHSSVGSGALAHSAFDRADINRDGVLDR